jgi:citrate lyase beta subunit
MKRSALELTTRQHQPTTSKRRIVLRHFDFLTQQDTEELFFVTPEEFTKESDKAFLSFSLGATLYIPATRPDLLNDLFKMRKKDATSVVVCLEDSIPDNRVEEAEENLHKLLKQIDALGDADGLPLIFVRPRNPEHLLRIAEQNKQLLSSLTGFVFPKFDALTDVALNFVQALRKINKVEKTSLYYMPVLETPSIIHRETRKVALAGITNIIAQSQENMLAVRIGATDFSSAYGLRRSGDFTVYDVHVVASAISDIVNILGRSQDSNIITGAVWEHFTNTPRTFRTQLRESIFAGDKKLRAKLLTEGYDNFIREIQLDKINGITGKTVIHPSHIRLVHSLMVVSHEEYHDALDILKGDNAAGGAQASTYKNKMNETKPHSAWAEKIVKRAQAFGVSNENIDFVDFLEKFDI